LKIHLYIIFICIVLSICCSHATSQQTTIDYDKLKEIESNVVLDISENHSEPFGLLKDLIVMPDGSFLVSDIGKTTIEKFSSEGEYEGAIAKSGRGPGELPYMFSLEVDGYDTLIVQHNSSTQIDLWGLDRQGNYRYERSMIRNPGSFNETLSFKGSYSKNKRYVVQDFTKVELNLPDYRTAKVIIMDGFQNIVLDSLYTLKKPNFIYEDPKKYSTNITFGGLTPVGIPPYRYEDRFIVIDKNRYLIARPDKAIVNIYSSDHTIQKKIHLNIKQREVEENDLILHFAGMDRKTGELLKKYVPLFKPPFLNIWASQSDLLLHTDNTKKGKEMVVLTMDGKPEGKLYLSEYDEIKYFRNKRIYTLNKNPISGHSIRIYQVNLPK